MVGITHTHDECVESHGPCLHNQIAVAQTVVVGTPAVTDLIGLVALEEARLATFKCGYDENGRVGDAVLVAANHVLNGCQFLLAHRHIIL